MNKRIIYIFTFFLLAIILILLWPSPKISLTNLTRHPGFDAYPSVSPDGSQVAFISNREGNYELFIMDISSGHIRQLTHNAVDEISPSWSPDGRQIVFCSNRDGYNAIFTINIITLKQQKIFSHSYGALHDPAWSPDGAWIAFSCHDLQAQREDTDIYILNLFRGQPINLTESPGYNIQPSWSPDGEKIVFISDRDGNWELYSMNMDGSYQTNLSQNPAEEASPCFSSDGNHILFVSARHGNHEIYLMENGGTKVKRITHHEAKDLWPSWMPDNHRFVFYSKREGNGEIFLMGGKKNVIHVISESLKDFITKDIFRSKKDKKQSSHMDSKKHTSESSEYSSQLALEKRSQEETARSRNNNHSIHKNKSPLKLNINILGNQFKYVPKGFPHGQSVSGRGLNFRFTPREILKKEPVYQSDSLVYGCFHLGTGKDSLITCVWDKNRNGEYVLYIDCNNNEDLTDDRGPLRYTKQNIIACNVPLQVQYRVYGKDQFVPYRIWLFLEKGLWIFPDNSGFYSKCYYKGFVQLGSVRHSSYAFDKDADGLYSDDGIYIDLNLDNQFSKNIECFHVGDTLLAQVRTYMIESIKP